MSQLSSFSRACAAWALCAALTCMAPVATAKVRVGTTRREVRVDGGLIRGAVEHGVIAFEGIPYAAPPVGALRWAPPQPVKRWRGIRPALHFGPDCAQLPTPGDDGPVRTVPRENCLYLNVWLPKARSAHGLPVMVWIYGGGFVNGGTSPAIHDGTQFARDGVVLVSFNYRLGNFGLFAFPALDRQAAGGLRADYVFMDQIAALQWVRRNVASFGGDPSNVTVFGESAGGRSVNALLMSPLARGLFAKAIIESGAGRDNVRPLRPLSGPADSAQAIGIRLARHLGIAGEGPGALAQLRALPAAKLVDGLNMATDSSDPTFVGGPILDARLYPGAPTTVYAAGGGARVPVMIGTNTDEAAGDQVMAEPARAIARLLSARGQRVYEYRFGYVASALRKTQSGARHASEIPYVFDTVSARYGKETSRADEAMAHVVHAYWIAFARTGRPDPRCRPAWPEYHESSDELMSFTDHGPVPEADPWKTRLDIAERAEAARSRATMAPGLH
jgi:para-nitrobenzyl esterase